MTHQLRLDFVSDIACPWCAIGLFSLEAALEELEGEIKAEIAFHPFELNPDLAPGGENGLEHVAAKYRVTPDQVRENRARIRERDAEVGLVMATSDTSRIYNTFAAHRLVAWAGDEGRQLAMKEALFRLYFTDGRDPSDPDALAAAAEEAGLDGGRAREVLASGAYAEQVLAEEALWRDRGITSVPAVVVAGRYLISGGQPPTEFVRQLQAIAAQTR